MRRFLVRLLLALSLTMQTIFVVLMVRRLLRYGGVLPLLLSGGGAVLVLLFLIFALVASLRPAWSARFAPFQRRMWSLRWLLYVMAVLITSYLPRDGISDSPLVALLFAVQVGMLSALWVLNYVGNQPSTSVTSKEELSRNRGPAVVDVLLAVFIAALPGLLAWLSLSFVIGSNVASFVPNQWNDQVVQWHAVNSIRVAGFESGYYAPDEVLPPLEQMSYAVHETGFNVLFGYITRVVGWGLGAPLRINAAMVGCGVLVFILLTRPSRTQLVFVSLIILVIWQVPRYILTSSQESFHHAFAFILAGLVGHLITKPSVQPGLGVFGILLLVFLSLIRISWALLVPAYVCLVLRPTSSRRCMAGFLFGLLVVSLLYWVTTRYIPAHNSTITELGAGIIADRLAGLNVILRHFNWNLDTILEYHPSFYVVALSHSIILLGAEGVATERSVSETTALTPSASGHLFIIYNLLTLVTIALLVYLAAGFDRLFAPHILLGFLIWVQLMQFDKTLNAAAVALVGLPFFVVSLYFARVDFTVDKDKYANERHEMATALSYNHGESNRWCNTVLVSLEMLDYRATVIPSGLGVSYIVNHETLQSPVHSKYLWLNASDYDRLAADNELTFIDSVSDAGIYLNQGADCN